MNMRGFKQHIYQDLLHCGIPMHPHPMFLLQQQTRMVQLQKSDKLHQRCKISKYDTKITFVAVDCQHNKLKPTSVATQRCPPNTPCSLI